MKILKVLGTVVQVAAPVVVALVATPVTGALVAVGLGAGKGTKILGKLVEDYTGVRLHKVASPVAAVAMPALLANWFAPDTVEYMRGMACQMCEDPNSAIPLIIFGLISWATHQVGDGVKKVGGQK